MLEIPSPVIQHRLYCLTQRQEQTKDESSEEDLRAQVEPDVRLRSRPSQGFPQPHAGANHMGPAPVTRGGQHLYGRGATSLTNTHKKQFVSRLFHF